MCLGKFQWETSGQVLGPPGYANWGEGRHIQAYTQTGLIVIQLTTLQTMFQPFINSKNSSIGATRNVQNKAFQVLITYQNVQ